MSCTDPPSPPNAGEDPAEPSPGEHDVVEVVLPPHPPVLNSAAAAALLRLLQRVSHPLPVHDTTEQP